MSGLNTDQNRTSDIGFERIKALYRQAPNSMLAALTVALYMAVTMWDKVAHHVVLTWLAALAATQLIRIWAYLRYRREVPNAARTTYWANWYTSYMATTGVVWASSAFLFMHADQPLANALVMMGLYGLGAGSIAGVAYHPPTLVLFLLFTFTPVAVRLISFGGGDYITLGIASAVYMCLLIVFGLILARSIVASMQVRFENLALVDQLQVEKAVADEARNRAEEANLAKSRFFAAASHDLRQPLHALSLYSASMRVSGLRQEQMPLLDNMTVSIDALESLFDELLDISKLDAGVIQPNLQVFPLQPVFERISAQFGPLADEQHLRLVVRPTSQYILSDPVLLERVLNNLVTNALRYTHQGGVLLACRLRNDCVSIEVWDTGIGISSEHQEKIFEEFYQVHNPERDRRKGLGLGLAIVQRLSALMNHPLALASRLGRGTVFRLSVPLASISAAAITEAPSATPLNDLVAGKRILVIDDEPMIRQGMQDLFSRWGVEVDLAANGAEAIQCISTLENRALPHLIITDYRLPNNENGLQLVAQLALITGRHIPVILITGDTSPERLQEVSASGYVLLHKPVRPAQLRSACNQLLAN